MNGHSRKKLSIISRGIRQKLIIAFALMSVLPLLICAYLVVNYIFPSINDTKEVSITILVSILISVLGFYIAKKLIDPIIDMSSDARAIARGNFDIKLGTAAPGEIGDLGESINIITQRIKDNMDELRAYGEKTRQINLEIHKKVLALSNLLQIGDIITASTELNNVLELALEKISQIYETGYALIYLPDKESYRLNLASSYNIPHDAERIKRDTIEIGEGVIGKIVLNKQVVAVDSTTSSPEVDELKSQYNLKNAVLIPIFTAKKIKGFLATGNQLDDFKYTADDIELIKVFARQVFIAIENDALLKKAAEVSIKDELTDLYNLNFIKDCLSDEIHRSVIFQRPCSFIVFNVDNFNRYRSQKGELQTETVLKRVAKVIKDSATQISKAARLGGDEFAVLVPEKNKKEAAIIAESIRRKIEEMLAGEPIEGIGLTISGGVSENPLDGATADELLSKAMASLKAAKAEGKNRIVA